MSDRLEDTSLRLKDEMDLYKRMMDKLRHNRRVPEGAGGDTGGGSVGSRAPPPYPTPPAPLASVLLPTGLFPLQLIEDLRKELEHLQMYKLTASGRAGAAARLPASASSTLGPRGRVGARGQAAQAGRPPGAPIPGHEVSGPLGVRLLFRG